MKAPSSEEVSSAVKSSEAASISLSYESHPSLFSPTQTKCRRFGTSSRNLSASPMPSGPETIIVEPECSARNFRSPERSWGAQGTAMAPSLRRPVRIACHSGTLPRRTITLSPRPTPRVLHTLANLFESWEKSSKPRRRSSPRSEEHTSELQSRQYLACRLLLEKKNR